MFTQTALANYATILGGVGIVWGATKVVRKSVEKCTLALTHNLVTSFERHSKGLGALAARLDTIEKQVTELTEKVHQDA